MRCKSVVVFTLVVVGLILSVGVASAQIELNMIAAWDVADWINRNAEKFSEYYGQEVKINVKATWGEAYVEELALMSAANISYDVVQVNPGRNFHFFAETQLFQDLDPLISRDGFDVNVIYPPTYQDAVIDGKTYALAFAAHPGHAGVYYNKNHFDRMGVAPPHASWTFDELAEKAIRLTERTADGVAVHGLQLPVFWAVSPAFDADVVSPDMAEALPNREGFLALLDWLLDLANRNVLVQWEGLPFHNGQAAMQFDGPWNGASLRNSVVDGEWDVAPFPTGPAGAISGAAAWDGFAIPRTSNHPDVAWEFIKFMLSEDAMVDFGLMGGNPVANIQINLYPELISLPGREVYVRALEAGQFVFDQPQEIQSLQERYIGGWALGPVLTGEMSPDQAAETIATEVSAILSRLAE